MATSVPSASPLLAVELEQLPHAERKTAATASSRPARSILAVLSDLDVFVHAHGVKQPALAPLVHSESRLRRDRFSVHTYHGVLESAGASVVGARALEDVDAGSSLEELLVVLRQLVAFSSMRGPLRVAQRPFVLEARA